MRLIVHVHHHEPYTATLVNGIGAWAGGGGGLDFRYRVTPLGYAIGERMEFRPCPEDHAWESQRRRDCGG